MSPTPRILFLAVLLPVVAACSGTEEGTATPTADSDALADGALLDDTALPVDTTLDATQDTWADAEFDGATDVATDAVLPDVPEVPPDAADDTAGDAVEDAIADVTQDVVPDAADDAAETTDTLQPQPGIYAGHCNAAFAMPAEQPWQHTIASPIISLAAPNHRIRDLILPVGTAGKLRGRFTYGIIDKDLGDEAVELWVQTCPTWVSWGTGTTDADGILWFDVPANLPQGDYRVKMVVLGDTTVADGVLAVWPKGVQVIVTDVDGTLTTNDWELFQDVLTSQDAQMWPGADQVMQAWEQKGLRLVYLTGRPQAVNRYSRTWLADHGFPLGPLQLAETATEVLPTESGVQKFKGDWLTALQQDVAVVPVATYGNATTDAGAYLAAGVAKANVWLIGPNKGDQGTMPIESYPAHLPVLAGYPDAVQP
jgi:hypothetical protein